MCPITGIPQSTMQPTVSAISRRPSGGPRPAPAARDLSVELYPALAPEAATFKPAALTANCRQ